MKIISEKIGANKVELKGYIHDDFTSLCDTYKDRPAVIVCPGGAYRHLSNREQDPVAMPLFSAGYHVFILYYSTGVEDIKKSEPEAELAEAVCYLKKNATELNISPDKIAVLGFSAGGHVAASLACHWNQYGVDSKPDSAVLCYPVITTDPKYCNQPSVDNLCYGDEARIQYFSLEKQVSSETIPCFIWHTTEDQAVPMQNSIWFSSALADAGVPFEYHLFQKGRHGLSGGRRETGEEEKGVQVWIDLCVAWLNDRWGFVL